METQSTNPESEKTRRPKKKIDLTLKEGESIISQHEEIPTKGLAAPEISKEYAAEVTAKDEARLEGLKQELRAQMAVPKGSRDAIIIEKLKEEIKELDTLVRQETSPEEVSAEAGMPEAEEKKEGKLTIFAINSQIEALDQKLKTAIDKRLEAIRQTDSAAFRSIQKEILEMKDKLTNLRTEREKLREANKTFVKERMREALAHYEKSKKEKERHAALAETGVTLDELKERELNKKDMGRWNMILEMDAKQNRESEDYKSLRSEYESLEPEATAEFIKSLRAEAKTGNFNMQHAAEQLLTDIDAGRVAGFTELESKFFTADAEEIRARAEAIETMGKEEVAEEAVAEWEKIKKQSAQAKGTEAEKKFFAASEKEAHARAEAIETMGPEMTIEEAVVEWEKIKQQSAKGEKESRREEEAFIDYLHEKYPNYIDFTGKQYSEARTKPKKVGFFKKLFNFGKPQTRLEEMEEALDNLPNVGKLAGKFLLSRKSRFKKEQRPILVKSR